jgi:uncharacterized protein YdaU (DUF1376 family)
MNRAPAFQFYPKDWFDFRVQRMSLAAQGAYLRLLCFMWVDSHNQCSIIDNNELLARAIGTTVEQWLELRAEIQCESDPIFEEKSGCLVSARLRLEASKQRKYRESQAEKGKRSAQQRFNRGSTAVQPEYQPEPNSSSSSSSSLKKEEKIAGSTASSPARGTSRRIVLADDAFIAALKQNPAYRGIDIDREIGRINAWLLTPKGRGKRLTRQRLVQWLNNIDQPMNGRCVTPPARPTGVVL